MNRLRCCLASACLLLGLRPALSGQSTVAQLSCQGGSASLTVPLLGDSVSKDLLDQTSSNQLSIAAVPGQLPALLTASLAAPSYSSCSVSGGVLPYTLTGVSFAYTPGLSGASILITGLQPYLVAAATFNYKTLTIGGVTAAVQAPTPGARRGTPAEAQGAQR